MLSSTSSGRGDAIDDDHGDHDNVDDDDDDVEGGSRVQT